ncbi:hypothetical protein F5B19DRAFT_494138 [Rostrohypoxylon terebratum]|nr:hypothetical protein F5B19DRAFT_494138 [Rostrohypoxylon terebratum]
MRVAKKLVLSSSLWTTTAKSKPSPGQIRRRTREWRVMQDYPGFRVPGVDGFTAGGPDKRREPNEALVTWEGTWEQETKIGDQDEMGICSRPGGLTQIPTPYSATKVLAGPSARRFSDSEQSKARASAGKHGIVRFVMSIPSQNLSVPVTIKV